MIEIHPPEEKKFLSKFSSDRSRQVTNCVLLSQIFVFRVICILKSGANVGHKWKWLSELKKWIPLKHFILSLKVNRVTLKNEFKLWFINNMIPKERLIITRLPSSSQIIKKLVGFFKLIIVLCYFLWDAIRLYVNAIHASKDSSHLRTY